MSPDRFDSTKLYVRIANSLMSKILSGELRPGSQIPTEGELCREFNVSKITVRRAVDILVFEGYLEKLQGKGTFVTRGVPRGAMSMRTTLVESVFMPGGRENITVLDKKVVKALDGAVAKRMGPLVDNEIFFLRRLKSSEGVPVLVNDLYVPLRVCPALAGWEVGDGSVYEFLRENTTLRITRVEQGVEIGRADAASSADLKVRPSSPCMVIHRLFTAPGGITLAYSKTVARPDRFVLETAYERGA